MAVGKAWGLPGISRPPEEVGRIWPCQCSGPKLGQERGIWAEDLTGPWGYTTCSNLFLPPAPRERAGQDEVLHCRSVLSLTVHNPYWILAKQQRAAWGLGLASLILQFRLFLV